MATLEITWVAGDEQKTIEVEDLGEMSDIWQSIDRYDEEHGTNYWEEITPQNVIDITRVLRGLRMRIGKTTIETIVREGVFKDARSSDESISGFDDTLVYELNGERWEIILDGFYRSELMDSTDIIEHAIMSYKLSYRRD